MSLKILNQLSLDKIPKEDFDNFYNIVVSDIKNQSSEEISTYLHDHIDLWLFALQILRRDIEVQLSCQKEKVRMHKANSINNPEFILSEYLDKQANWRMSAVNFLSNIERKTLYVKFLINSR